MSTIEQLQQKFAIPNLVEIVHGLGNLPAVRVIGKHRGQVYLHGAHITHWQPAAAQEVLWLSEKSIWENNKPIRGGIPICFPWFGPNKADPTAPAHGFARLKQWNLEAVTAHKDAVTIILALASDDSTRKLWPHDFVLHQHVTFGPELTISLILKNTGSSPLTAEEALHTYFSVTDIKQTSVIGLDNTAYIDKTDAMKEKTQSGPITITAETDRVYLNTTAATTIDDPSTHRKITIAKEGSNNTVVWNPWIVKAKAMPDFGDQEWPHMICVETCNVGSSPVTLAPHATHTLTARISVSPA